jgi:hypothetical protein
MTDTTQSSLGTRRERTALVGAVTFAVAVGLPVTGILTAGVRDVDVEPGLIDWIFVAAVATVTLVTFGALGLWLRRRPRANTAAVGLALGVVAAAASVVAFWTMVPVVLGSAAAWLGLLGHRTAAGSRTPSVIAIGAVALGALAALGSVVMYVATS